MAKSVLRLARTEKHDRLFELIRQGNLAEKSAAQANGKASKERPAQMLTLRDQAVRSIQS
jgi:hypothetical protein